MHFTIINIVFHLIRKFSVKCITEKTSETANNITEIDKRTCSSTFNNPFRSFYVVYFINRPNRKIKEFEKVKYVA